ncbi:hypothetical protein NZD89_00935 [Alicyclobacillus fastidiosus]|uniref:Uncharacterized protein n=1 Tax=Alicyclobacillus fastidiosus TaxID=392011 RepID=A0ABY6ZJ31_9BACL|nr:hypothetical protein [Alicyclobacillus fastidiosus]WAH42116.1 hypothetical protein NZD89_00935 [Alicyclobacillus fastidiosus]
MTSLNTPDGAPHFTAEVEAALAALVGEMKGTAPVQMSTLDGVVPAWEVRVGSQSARVNLYDVEQRRSVPTESTPGLNELRSTREAVRHWYRETFTDESPIQ